MSWAVGYDFDHRRFRGYGVPAYCDAKGCDVEIDRGLGFVCEGMWCHGEGEGGCVDLDPVEVTTFVCGEHSCADVDWDDLPTEHPDWIAHLLTDSTWAEWRKTNPEKVRALRGAV